MMGRRKRYLKIQKIPPEKDPRWVNWTQPLQVFLSKPRVWDDIIKWMDKQKITLYWLLNMIAWLENKDYLKTYEEHKKTYWIVKRRQL
jgi:hypothetical protein